MSETEIEFWVRARDPKGHLVTVKAKEAELDAALAKIDDVIDIVVRVGARSDVVRVQTARGAKIAAAAVKKRRGAKRGT